MGVCPLRSPGAAVKLFLAVAALLFVVAVFQHPRDTGRSMGDLSRTVGSGVDGFVEGLLVFGDNLGDER